MLDAAWKHLSGASRVHPRSAGGYLVESLEGVALNVGFDVREAAAQVGPDHLAQQFYPDLQRDL